MPDPKRVPVLTSPSTSPDDPAARIPRRSSLAVRRFVTAVGSRDPDPSRLDADYRGAVKWEIENNLVTDVMTRAVVSVTDEAPFKEIVDTFAFRRIGAAPVVDVDHRVLGVVSMSDLLAKLIAEGGRGRSADADHHPSESTRRKADAETARELMTSPAVTVAINCSVVEAARTAARAHVRRLPVLDSAGVLAGIVSRSDLLRVFCHSDEDLHEHLVEDVLTRQYCLEPGTVGVSVLDGVVTLVGQVETGNVLSALLDTVRTTSGVVAVHARLSHPVEASAPALPIRLY